MKLYLRKSTELKDLFIALKAHILTLNRDFNYRIEVIKIDNDCTLQQKRALFGLAYKIIRDHNGVNVNESHEYFCGEWFGWIEYVSYGYQKRKPTRTITTDYDGKKADLSTVEFMKLYEFIQMRAAQDMCLNIPDPDPFYKKGE